ncbi:MAG TPA: M1 family aminopeptidase [Acidobacteriaceae bacterium]|jgi:aminopeptidase N|nr:M1 family aminopeptidase [Acidobacteriaceae bacterium]
MSSNSVLKKRCSVAVPALGFLVFALLLLGVLPGGAPVAHAAEKQQIHINGYGIDVTLDPTAHTIKAKTTVSFTALDNLNAVSFGFNNALRVSSITDSKGQTLTGENSPADSTIRVTPSAPLTKGQTATWTFEYAGILNSADASPVPGLKLASIDAPISYLLYAARWFPMVGYMTNRFTSEIHVHVPHGYRVIGSGFFGAPKMDPATGETQFDFRWNRLGFPGTIIAGQFLEPYAVDTGTNVRVYVTDKHKASGQEYAQSADKEFDFFSSLFGQPESNQLNVVELPDDTVPAYWAPEIAAVAGAHIPGKSAYRLLANTIAHQWWSSQVSPATLNDAWITNGMCRYAELMYVENTAGKTALSDAILDVAAGALAYDTIPLADSGRYTAFSPEFQSMTYEKGAMIFHMLRWEIGEETFKRTMSGVLTQYADKPVSTSDLEKIAEAQSQLNLQPFFSQWLFSTGAPAFKNKYTVYRLGNGKGFRTVGEIQQDLDLFNMPIEIRVETEGKTVDQRVDVVGTQSQYVIDTFGIPRKISLDPNNWVLKNGPDMQVRVHILRGQELAAQGDYPGAIQEYHQAIAVNSISSLASYRLGEVYFLQRNYQAAADAYRDCLRGDDDPKWTEVWSYIQLGKIFDATGQRDRAVNEYRQALQTNDNTAGALNLARGYLQKPFKPVDTDGM